MRSEGSSQKRRSSGETSFSSQLRPLFGIVLRVLHQGSRRIKAWICGIKLYRENKNWGRMTRGFPVSRLQFRPCFKSLTSVTLDSDPSLFSHLTYQHHLTSINESRLGICVIWCFCWIPASRHLANGRIITSDCCLLMSVIPSEPSQLPNAGIPLGRSSCETFQARSHQADALTLPTRTIYIIPVPFIYVRWCNPFLSFSDVPYFCFYAPSIILHFLIRWSDRIAG